MSLPLKTIRERCVEIIQAVQPDALVIPRWIQFLDTGECPDVLRAYDNMGAPLPIKAWLLSVTDENRAEGDEESASIFTDVATVRIWGFLQYDFGTNAENSEDRFEVMRREVQDAFSNAPELGFMGSVLGHSQLQYSECDVYPFCDVQLHIAKGALQVFQITTLPLEDQLILEDM